MFRRASTANGVQTGIAKARAVCDAVARGDFEARNIDVDDPPGFRDLFLSINDLIDRTDAYVRESAACLEHVSANKYYRRIAEKGMLGAFRHASRTINQATENIAQRVADFSSVVETFERTIGEVVNTVSSAAVELESSSGALSNTANAVKERATAVAAASEEASSNVGQVAASSEELSSSISEISQQVARSAERTAQAVEAADDANAEVNSLSERSEKIGAVIDLISEIAGQTNLLALNATIEAARAGEAGKGFAVVASEVKNLAKQTAKATEEIGGQVAAIQGATASAVATIQRIGAVIRELDQIGSAIAAAVEEQSAATQEIARNVDEAAKGTAEVSHSIHDVTVGASESGDAASQVKLASEELARQGDVLRREVDQFLEAVHKVV
jgi:methyl-accepting chemotaxis protein